MEMMMMIVKFQQSFIDARETIYDNKMKFHAYATSLARNLRKEMKFSH